MTDPAHFSYADLLAKVEQLRRYEGVLMQIGYFHPRLQFFSMLLTDEQMVALRKACELSAASPEETITTALECWLDYKASCQRNKRYEMESEAEGKFGK